MENKKIKVLHIIHSMDMCGAETLIMNVYRKINKDKFQFDFIVSRSGYFDDEIKSLGGKIYKIEYLTKVGQFKYKKELKKIFNKEEYNIVHSHIDQVSGIILEAAKESGINIRIAHSHNTSNSNGMLGKIYKKYLQSKINKNANVYLACSKNAGKWLYREKSAETIVIRNGMEINKFKYSEEKKKEIRKELNVSENTTVIGNIGAFRKQKNHLFLIEIFNEYLKIDNNAVLLLIGEGDLKESVKEKVNLYNIEKNVRFLGTRNDTDKLYSAFDIYLFPSLYEGLSLSLIEAQIAGLNIYTSDTVDKATDVSGTIKSLSLSLTAKEWANAIFEGKNKRRYDNIERIKDAGYDIENTVNSLEKIYSMENLDEKNNNIDSYI